jgi:hypothetical protein
MGKRTRTLVDKIVLAVADRALQEAERRIGDGELYIDPMYVGIPINVKRLLRLGRSVLRSKKGVSGATKTNG